MVRQIASHAPTHQKPPKEPAACTVSAAAAFAPLATSGALFGSRDVAVPKHRAAPSAASSKPVPSTEAARRALEEATLRAPDVPSTPLRAHSPRSTHGAERAPPSTFGKPHEPAVARPASHHRATPVPAPPSLAPRSRALPEPSTPPVRAVREARTSTSAQEVFERYDANASGFLDYRELRSALHSLGIDLSLEGSAEILRRFDENHDGRMDFLEFNRLVDSLQAVSKRHGRYDAHIPEREVQPQSLATPVQYAECCPSCTNADGSYPWREEWHSAGRLHDDGKHAHVAWGYGAAHSRHDGEQNWGSVKDEYEDAGEAERRRQLRLRLMEEALHIRTSQDSPFRQLVELEALPLVLGSGPMAPIRLVRASFVIGLWQDGRVLPSRQEMPEDAFYSGLPGDAEIIAISSPWLTDTHPDPLGDHLAFIAPPLLSLLESYSRAHHAMFAPPSEVAVFWDYMSIFQETLSVRTPAEQHSFSQSLASSAVLFAHRDVSVWIQTTPPMHPPGDGRSPIGYFERGLCVWELHLTALLKDPRRLLDIGQLYCGDHPPSFADFERDVRAYCIARRPPPVIPTRLDALLWNLAFSSALERETACALYAQIFETAASEAQVLLFGSMEWGEQDAILLAEALPSFQRLRYLDLSNNALGEDAVGWLSSTLPPTLEEINLDGVLTIDGKREVRNHVKRAARSRLARSIGSPHDIGNDVTFKLNKVATRGYDELFMVAVVGDSGTGKSSIRNRFSDDIFDEVCIPTVGIDFSARTVLHRGCQARIQIWDAAGSQDSRTMDESHFYRRVHGVVIVFDLSDRRSFHNVKGWLREVNRFARQDVCKILLGNKCDLIHDDWHTPTPPVSHREAQRLAEQHGMLFVAASAKVDKGIDFAFVTLLDDMLAMRDPDRFAPARPVRSPVITGLRCALCCLPKSSGRLGPDEFLLSTRNRNDARYSAQARGCSIM